MLDTCTCTLPSESKVFPSRVKHSAIVAVPILWRPCNQWLRPIKNIYLTFEQSNNWNSLSNLCQIVKCPPLFLTACIVSKTRSIVVLFRVKKQPEKKTTFVNTMPIVLRLSKRFDPWDRAIFFGWFVRNLDTNVLITPRIFLCS